MSDDEDIAALVVDNGSGMCKGKKKIIANNTNRRSLCVVVFGPYLDEGCNYGSCFHEKELRIGERDEIFLCLGPFVCRI